MSSGKIKVFWISDAVAATGFARVAHSILDELAKMDLFDIHVLGINYFGDPHTHNYGIYPASALGSHVLGFQRVQPLIEYLKPDVVFLLNDIWVTPEYFRCIPESVPIVTYSPVDARSLNKVWLKEFYERVAIMCVYTQFAHDVVVKSYPLLNPTIVPHGVDSTLFYPVDMLEARGALKNVEGDEWIVLNANRNQPRKKIDSTLRAFAEFAADKPKNVKLYLHMALADAGWNIQEMWERLGLLDRIIITHPTYGPQNPVSNEMLNAIYNSCDVGINTSMGEGWGLPNFEHAATGHVQIIPNSSACAELFAGGRGLLIDVFEQPSTHTGGVNTDGAVVVEKSAVAQMQYAYEHPEECREIARKMYDYLMRPEFRWEHIAAQFAKYIILAARAGPKKKINDDSISE